MDQYITPTFAKIMGKAMTPEPSSVPALAQTRDDAPIDPSVPDKIQFELPETSWYLLQMGAYADPEEAHAQALLIQSMGAGGYIYEDEQGFTRVFAAPLLDSAAPPSSRFMCPISYGRLPKKPAAVTAAGAQQRL